VCGNRLVSYARADGSLDIVDPGPGVIQSVVTDSLVASRHEDASRRDYGRVLLFDTATNKLLADKVPPELARSVHNLLIARLASPGVCVLGLVASGRRHPIYRAGCYDAQLRAVWTKALPSGWSEHPIFDLRQEGPHYLVLDDQSTPLDSSRGGTGRGVLVRWLDGQITELDDHTFATIEDQNGVRVSAARVKEAFERVRGLASEHEGFDSAQAKVVADQRRVFALVRNGSTGLVGIDPSTGRALFVVPVPLGGVWALELAAGFPIVRTVLGDAWRASIYDPGTGRVLYRDQRVRRR
jgi:hypothetical protein